MLCGILPVNKPSGISSFDVIRRIKRVMPPEWKKEKIGHGGTLDNLADGVLPVLFGEATKAFDFLLQSDKIYRAIIRLGVATDTDDSDGKIILTSDKKISFGEVEALLPDFTGEIMQVPPRYSALKVDGRRSYELARGDVAVEHKPRKVTVHELNMESYDAASRTLVLIVRCSSGTYIRSIARDIGHILGCGGHIAGLTRLKSAGILLEECTALDSITADNIESGFIDLNGALSLPVLELKADAAHIRNGKPLFSGLFSSQPSEDGAYKVCKDGGLLAIVEKSSMSYKYLRVFNV